MVYVALMRGINVGGKNKVDMKRLKAALEAIPFESVVTYINSGNVIFTHHRHTKAEIASLIEAAIKEHFNLAIKVLVLSLTDFQQIMAALPGDWKNDQTMRSDVMFLWEAVDMDSLPHLLPVKPGVDQVIYAPGAVLWSVDRQHATRSGLIKLVGTELYRKMTIRNVNTTRKIYGLMNQQVQE